jgi:hypothetical protein
MLQVYVLMFHPFHTDVAFKCFMLFGWLRDTRSDGGTAQVLGNDGRGDLGGGGQGAPVRARRAWGTCAGRGERFRIKADKAGCACEVSRVDAWALRQDGCTCGTGIKSAHWGRLRGRPDVSSH